MTNEQPVVQTNDNNATNFVWWFLWIIFSFICAGVVYVSFLETSSTSEEDAQGCISSYSEDLAKQYTNEKMVTEVLGYSDIEILTSPKDSGYYLLDFNVRLSTKVGQYTTQKNNPVSGFKCFHDNAKYLEWQKNNPSN